VNLFRTEVIPLRIRVKREDEKEDVSSYWMDSRKREDARSSNEEFDSAL
jgi:hypothetical protein